MPGQRVLLFRNDKWFNAYDPASRGMGTDCPTRASHADVSLHVEKGNFYGQAGQVIQSNVVQQEPVLVPGARTLPKLDPGRVPERHVRR